MILMIDNYDSFTYNLVQAFQVIGENVQVRRNNKVDLSGMKSLNPASIVISPGPGSPDDAGISVEAIGHFGPELPRPPIRSSSFWRQGDPGTEDYAW